jgi:hypothetical protein
MDISPSLTKRRRLIGKQPWPRVTISASLIGPPLPEPCLRIIASFSGNPPGIYSLCLSTKAFHVPQPQGPLLATKLLREALNSSLHRVLQHLEVPAAAVGFANLISPNGPGAVVSGSTMVQVVLGEVWKASDIDIFCTAATARAVRSKLVGNGFTLARMHNDYSDAGSGMLAFSLESKVHHVEGWATTPADGEIPDQLEGWAEAPKPFEFTTACRYGKTASSYFYGTLNALAPFNCRESADQVIAALPGKPLSYNYQLKDRLDLVVAESSCNDARELLQSFDIVLCAAYYDGNAFHIPSPHMAFKKQSPLEPKRLAMMTAFATEWPNMDRSPDLEDLTESGWFKAIEKSISGAGVKDRTSINKSDSCNFAGRFYWNFFAKLFLRQRKYIARGIHLAGRPRHFGKISASIRVQDIQVAY